MGVFLTLATPSSCASKPIVIVLIEKSVSGLLAATGTYSRIFLTIIIEQLHNIISFIRPHIIYLLLYSLSKHPLMHMQASHLLSRHVYSHARG